jgi:hypothetical protein
VTELIKIMSAIIMANLITAVCLLGFYRMAKHEKEEGGIRFSDIAMFVIPILAALYGFYLWGAFEATPLRHLIGQPPAARLQFPE